jgi:hypothetical protein
MKPTITIKIKPYLQEFIICALGDEAPKASRRNFIGAILSPLLEYTPQDHVPRQIKGEDSFTFPLPREAYGKETRRGTLYVSKENQLIFERILRIYFKSIFFQFVDDKIRYNRQIKDCILMFCAHYQITFNKINYEMLKKSYYRYRKSLKKRSFFAHFLSLCCPLIILL